MKTIAVATRKVRGQDQLGAYLVVVLFLAVMFAFYARQFLPFGYASIIGGALVGFLWALLLGFGAGRLMRREEWRVWLAKAMLLPQHGGQLGPAVLVGWQNRFMVVAYAAWPVTAAWCAMRVRAS
jgi:hypothetical protein